MKHELYESELKEGKAIPCGYNLRHTITKVKNTSGNYVYQVNYYIPGYGTDKTKEYKTLTAAKAGITKYDKL